MTEDTAPRHVAVLVGNGLSIAFNNQLNLRLITEEMISRMENASEGGTQVVHAMNEIARRALADGEVTDGDFEKLVGAFDSQVLTLDELAKLAALVDQDNVELSDSIQKVAAFSQQVRDMGTSYILQVIMERSRADWTLHEAMHKLVQAVVDEFDGQVHFGNLNYDTLLLSSLLAIDAPMTDLGLGYNPVPIRTVEEDSGEDGPSYVGYPLRKQANFPTGSRYRVRLLHLHGSLTYWGHAEKDIHIKIPIDAIRRHHLWEDMREGNPEWRPDVVLANQRDKARHVERHPFKLAYEAFQSGLTESEHWLVIGYSFRDKCVNDILRNEFIVRAKKPIVLVSTYGELPTRSEVELAFGWGAEDGHSDWLFINRDGAEGLEDTADWALFTDMSQKAEAELSR